MSSPSKERKVVGFQPPSFQARTASGVVESRKATKGRAPKGNDGTGYGAPGSRHGSLNIGGQADMFQFNAKDLDQFKFRSRTGSSRLPGMSRNFQESSDQQEVPVNAFDFLKDTFGTRGGVAAPQPPVEDEVVAADEMFEAAQDDVEEPPEDGAPEGDSPRLETGEDAISFFAQNRGGNSQVKFVHLIREKIDIDFRPYDLTVVPPEECEAGGSYSHDYFTMSAAGLVHVLPGHPSDFTPLTEWMRQSMLFNMLRSIRFYKYYLHTKCFQLWHNNVRFKLYCQQRNKLGHKLFLAKSSFCMPMLNLKNEMLEMQSVKLLEVGSKTFEVANFVEHQAQKRNEASKRFEACMEKVQAIVQNVCSDVTNLARAKDGGDSPLDLALNAKLASTAHRSIVAIKQEELERKKLLRRASEEAGMLADFIRLADYVSVGSLVQLTVRTLAEFYAELLKPRKAGLFETTVQFVEEGTVFHPTCNDIQGIMGSMSDAMITSVAGVNRIIYNRPFTEHVSRAINDPPNVGEIIRSSVHFNQTRQSIDAKINEDFIDAQGYVVEFDKVRPIYEHNRDWDMASYKRRDHSMKSLKDEMDKVSVWEKELDRMKARQICGILEVETRRLKGILAPLTGEKLDALKTLVKDLARGKCKELLNKYRNSISKLSQRPVHLKDFANQTEQVASVLAYEKSLFKHTDMVENMYKLLTDYDVDVPSEDAVQLDDLRGYQQSYQENVEAAQGFKAERMPEMTAQLDMKIAGLNERLVAITAELQTGEYIKDTHFDDPTIVLEELQNAKQQLDTIDAHCKQYSAQQELFKITVYNYKNQATAMEQFEKQAQLWSMIHQWNEKYNEWMISDFIDTETGEVNIDVEEANKDVQIYVKESFGLHKKLGNNVSGKLKERTAEFKAKMPVILELGNPSMKTRHWEKLFEALGKTYSPGMPFTLKEMLDDGILDHAEAVSEQSATATGEAQLEGTLESIRDGWDKTVFTLNNHRDQEDVFVLGALDEIFLLLEDNQVTLQTMLGSRYIAGVRDEVESWEKRLALLSDTLDEWLACQKSWMYLETIFGAPDIQKQLPVEAQKFLLVDKSWKATLKACNENPKVIASIDDGDRLLKEFEYCVETLDQIQKSLEDYLQTKRMAFPRFYFLPNEDLIEILSQTRDPQAVQPHVGKCFDAIKRLQFGEKREAHNIKGFYDPKTEYVPSSEDVLAEGPVEIWLKSFENCMVKTLYDSNKLAWQQYPADGQPAVERKDWLFSAPAQIIIVVDEIVWTRNMARALTAMDDGSNPNATKEFWEFSVAQIEYMITLVQGDLTKGQRTMIGALVTIDVHAREVTADIVAKGVSSIRDFMWTKQLRYYWEEEIDDCTAKQTNTRFVYGYEYLGNGPRLVITPLTDKCYMTLTGALHMKLGGAPAGPAGTGKTETTKDLAKALAVFCVVFNCSDGLDYKMMGTFFSGLAQQGAWACFDEFNRIDIEVLSVIAQQILSIQQALFAEMVEFNFEDNMIPLSRGFGVFITMNPGYAGRTELPDNLQALFRPVAMMVPDYRLIAEIILYSEGFVDAVPLSNKMQQLYALSSEQLSKQDHYDFGMRAVKSVLVCAGLLKRKEPEANENLLLIRAMRDSNTPKFLEMDLPLFGGILKDLFPGIDVPFVDYGKLQSCIENQLNARNLQCVPSFITKIIQVHETQQVRHGMMVVGETGSGKTTNIKVLAGALGQLYDEGVVDKDNLYKKCELKILNPKAITAGELYGRFNLMTGEWFDGIVPKLVRECVGAANDGIDERKWVVFDGPVDAVWIENMNTVLDDNKMLCLANSERIKLADTMHMMFEVQDLKVASPATVSRCGMVYMEQVHVGIISLVRTWGASILAEFLPEHVETVVGLIEAHLDDTIFFMNDVCNEKVETSGMNLTQSLLNLLEGLLNPANGLKPDHPNMETLLKYFFVWSLVWSVGGNIDDASRPKFQGFVKERFASLLGSGASAFLDDIYGHVVNPDNAEFVNWSSLMEEFHYNPNQPYFNILVPTMDTTRYAYVLKKLMKNGFNVLFMGETGVGKSVIMQGFLDEMSRTNDYVSFSMSYSAQTKPVNLKDVMESKLEKKRKNLLGPPAGKKMLMFIDDLNMPAMETIGGVSRPEHAQPPNELLRQLIDQQGFYDTSKLFLKNVKDVIFASACAPPGGGRNPVTPRLLRHFSNIWLTNVNATAMSKIFSSILSGFLSQPGTEGSLKGLSGAIIDASIEIYHRMEHDMLPTPERSHYTFNLRDLSKVFQGILMVDAKHLHGKDELLKLWCHEKERVFRDRLINDDDRKKFNGFLKDQLAEKLSTDWEVKEFEDIMYGDYLTREDKEYQPVESIKVVQDLLVEYLEEYNMDNTGAMMQLVFFDMAVLHLSRICRVLRQPRGNALLVGMGGSGRQSLVRLSAFIADFELKTIAIVRGYGSAEFHEDLKEVLLSAGAKNKPTAFLLSDTQIVEESFLEDVNNILNSGEVPNLFAADEMEGILGKVRPLAKAAGKQDAKDVIMKYFVQLVRENLHVVLTMSPIGSAFRQRCLMFPSLVNCCTIDWFNAWPAEALYSVAHVKLSEKAADFGITEYVDQLCKMAMKVHKSVEAETERFFNQLKRRNYTTPTSYLELISLYVNMLSVQQEKVRSAEVRYRGGLTKLGECEVVVADLQVKLTAMGPELKKAAKETGELMETVKKNQIEADKQQAVVQVDVDAANIQAAAVGKEKDSVQADLDEAIPALNDAIKALDTIKEDDIKSVRGFQKPHPKIRLVCEGVCVFMGKKPKKDKDDDGKSFNNYWPSSQDMMKDAKEFVQSLKNYDKDNIDPKIVKKIKNDYMTQENFTVEVAKTASSACAGMMKWMLAMITYDRVAKVVGPKREALGIAEKELAVVMGALSKKQAELDKVLAYVAGLKQQLDEATAKKASLDEQERVCQVQLQRAQQLIGGLGGEKVRWGQSAERLSKDLVNLVGNVIISAGFISYLGPFTAEYRRDIASSWVILCKELQIPSADVFSLEKVLGDPVEIRNWQIMGLPADEFSTENGMLATMGRRWPLMIDPQGQANKWVRNMYASSNLQIIKLTQKDFLRTLENGIRYGACVLLENVQEELDPALEPVLLKQVFKKGGQNLLHLGDSDVPYSDEFRFVITTKLANPHYFPEVCIKVTVINFTVTTTGLEDQLLVDVIKSERPDLEARKDELVVNIAADSAALKDIEDQILQMLQNAEGNILDDEALINALDASKKTSAVIEVRLQEAEATTKEINETREGYRCVATRGSIIYFVIASLALVDPMYQYSLQYYKALFVLRLQRAEQNDVVSERLNILLEDITNFMYLNICRGLFERHKMLYSFMICANVARQANIINEKEWSCIMIGPGLAEAELLAANPCPDLLWLSTAWADLLMMEKTMPEIFGGLPDVIKGNTAEWQAAMIDTVSPQTQALPGGWEQKLTAFQKLLVLRALRPEKVVYGIRVYVSKELGSEFAESPPFNLEAAYEDSSKVTPLIFILSTGADPNDYLIALGASKGKRVNENLKIISLGQGQGPKAEILMEQSRKTGDWVCLQNCHLAVSWLGSLEAILEETNNEPDNIDSEYRLWLTSKPSDKFPVPVLQNGIKITNEPPKGMRANVLRTFTDITEEEYSNGSTKPLVYKRLLYATAFFNALILERKKFGAVGWNISYGWMNSDLKAGVAQVKMYVEENDEVPWETLRYIISEVTYGGRVTDAKDGPTIRSILARLYQPALMTDKFYFTSTDQYYAPTGTLEETCTYIKSLPYEDAPDIFGLHPNADITFQQNETKAMLDTIIDIAGTGGGGDGGDDDTSATVEKLRAAVQARLPAQYDERSAHSSTFARIETGAVNSLGVFLRQELERFNAMIAVVAKSLVELDKAMRGIVVMSAALEDMFNCFVFQRVPNPWSENGAGYPCLKPLASWVEDFFQRLEFMKDWLENGPRPQYWLSGFFFPQGFMTSIKQTFSRKYHIAVDILIVSCEVKSYGPTEELEKPEDGVLIYGLFMEAGRFDRTSMTLQDSQPSILFAEMPCILLLPMEKVKYNEITGRGARGIDPPIDTYECPLYKTSLRKGTLSTTGHSTNFVVMLDIPSKIAADQWVRRGTAMLCMLNT